MSTLTPNTPEQIAELAAMAERGELKIDHAKALHGEAARKRAHEILMEVTETENIDDAITVMRGRPRLDQVTKNQSPSWRIVTTPKLKTAVTQAAEAEGKTSSEYIRDVLTQHLHLAS